MRRRLLWALVVLLAALVVIAGVYHAMILRLERQHDQYRDPQPQYQRLVETAPP